MKYSHELELEELQRGIAESEDRQRLLEQSVDDHIQRMRERADLRTRVEHYSRQAACWRIVAAVSLTVAALGLAVFAALSFGR